MIPTDAMKKSGLFDFASTAKDYEGWYASLFGKTQDVVQKIDVVNVLKGVEMGTRLLDIGCGTGHWSRFFATLGFTVVGVDISPEMLHESRAWKSANTTFQIADAYALPFRDDVFDIITAMAVLEFMATPQQALDEMARCVREGGRLLIGALNRYAPVNQKRIAEGNEPYASGHLYTPKELQKLLASLGTVRMVASESMYVPADIYSETQSDASLINEVKGPFIVAEVRR